MTTVSSLPPEIVVLILDCLSAADAQEALRARVFWIDAEAEAVRRRCQMTKKRALVRGGDLCALKHIRKKRRARFVLQDMTLAAKGGHLDVVVWLHKHARGGYPCRVIEKAAAGGDLATVRWLCGHVPIRSGAIDAAIDAAAKRGHRAVIDYLADAHGGKGTPLALFWAVVNKHADIVDRLCTWCPANAGALYKLGTPKPTTIKVTNGVPNIDQDAGGDEDIVGLFDMACGQSNMHIIQRLWDVVGIMWTRQLFNVAAFAEGTEVIEFLWVHRRALYARLPAALFDTTKVMRCAAESGSIILLTLWNRLFGVCSDSTALAGGASGGHVALVDFLLAERVVPLADALEAAAFKGSESMVRSFLARGAPVTDHAVYGAVHAGRIDLVRLLYEHGNARGDWLAVENAIDAGRVDILTVLCAEGHLRPNWCSMLAAARRASAVDIRALHCALNPAAAKAPTVGDDADALEYAVAHKLVSLRTVFWNAQQDGDNDFVDRVLATWKRRGKTTPVLCDDAIGEQGRLDILQSIYDCGRPIDWVDSNVSAYAVINGHLPMVQWMHQRNILVADYWSATALMGTAASNGNRRVVEWLCEHGFRAESMDAPSCTLCADRPAEDHHAAEQFLRTQLSL
ncbi:Ankyrin repeat domain containing protein [Pandoravirus salinus]|uniref:Ankyrin repeat domain containing protein n=1 Tax=Pandoravirus salinus TaxID=1349410 RepID=S4W3A5_9VIRU|nr:ankyrin repeat domain [Pandoravirus salinus]AGO85087.1 Ankyrin repeat domain containing protein [Pandoravirus salinus]